MGYADARIGLEIHVPMATLRTKLFCGCSNVTESSSTKPNAEVCPVCLGLPGALPRPNIQAIRQGLTLAHALNCKTPDFLQFYRKHYFYPDLPKGYQITQYEAGGHMPLGFGGSFTLGNGKKIGIRRVHIEEDPARLVHPEGIGESAYVLVDYNRSGGPLLEIVTEPDLTTPDEARNFMEKLRELLTKLNIIQEDTVLKADANVSVKGSGRVEIKNIGSSADLRKALQIEIMRLRRYVEEGLEVEQETRHWDDRRKVTTPARGKETEQEYRYIPDLNIPPIPLAPIKQDIETKLTEILQEPKEELVAKYNLQPSIAEAITRNPRLNRIFQNILESDLLRRDTKLVDSAAKLLINQGSKLLKRGFSEADVAGRIKQLCIRIAAGEVTFNEAKRLVLEGEEARERIKQADKATIQRFVDEVLSEERITAKSRKILDYIVGKALRKMKSSGIKADPVEVAEYAREVLQRIAPEQEKQKEELNMKEEAGLGETQTIPQSFVKTDEITSTRKALQAGEGEATLAGWIESRMNLGGKSFIILRDWSGWIQCVVSKELDERIFNILTSLNLESFITVRGKLRRDERAPTGVELVVEELKAVFPSASLPLTLPQLAKSDFQIRLSYRFLDLRRRRVRGVFKIRSLITKLVREYLENLGFTEIHTPKIILSGSEGGAELFTLLYYGREAFLAQSPQLYKQMAVNAFERVYEIDSYYRAQKFDTPRHLAEFWSIDVEAALYDLDKLTSLAEGIVNHVLSKLPNEAGEELSILNVELRPPKPPYKRITYRECLDILEQAGRPIEFGEDIGAEELKIITDKIGGEPFFILYWPKECRAFYYKTNGGDSRITNSFDLVWPMKDSAPLELASGGERINDYNELIESLRSKGLNPESYEWYSEMFRYGVPPHGGFGMGLDRLVMAVCQTDTVLETVFSPRTPKYSKP